MKDDIPGKGPGLVDLSRSSRVVITTTIPPLCALILTVFDSERVTMRLALRAEQKIGISGVFLQTASGGQQRTPIVTEKNSPLYERVFVLIILCGVGAQDISREECLNRCSSDFSLNNRTSPCCGCCGPSDTCHESETYAVCCSTSQSFCGCNSPPCNGLFYNLTNTGATIVESFGACYDPSLDNSANCYDEPAHSWVVCPNEHTVCGAANDTYSCCPPGTFCNSTSTDSSPKCTPNHIRSSFSSLAVATPTNGTTNNPNCNCPTFLDCCNGPCYSRKDYTCWMVGSGDSATYQLCPNGTLLCGPDCYSPFIWACDDGHIYKLTNSTGAMLSTGGIIGIAVGAGVLLVLCVVLAIYLAWRWGIKKGKKKEKGTILTDVKIGEVIGNGYFGQVYRGTWNGTTVALKTIKKEGNDVDGRKWRDEIALLHDLNHPNIVRQYGIYATELNMFMVRDISSFKLKRVQVVEFAENGAVDVFLRKRSNADRLSNYDLLRMAFDVCKGMLYLQSQGVIHRDLAARNLLLDSQLRVKISDFGMSRHGKIYRTTSREIPYKWAAPEVLCDMESCAQSDVWSFVPYEGIKNGQIKSMIVEQGHRLSQPSRCSDEMYKLLLQCWQNDPDDRPNFREIYEMMMTTFPESLAQHEDVGMRKHLVHISTVSRYPKKASPVLHSPKLKSKDLLPPAARLQPNIVSSNPDVSRRNTLELCEFSPSAPPLGISSMLRDDGSEVHYEQENSVVTVLQPTESVYNALSGEFPRNIGQHVHSAVDRADSAPQLTHKPSPIPDRK
ncbi:tyrosine-protein kinase Fer isoform b [Planoprotostelium fungivorum]|uniref:Tyrosine-protein kinase Fer isoform b n=1 Tax=Planoprotostelium fungivorum TaxID=1890364 RepID=A0A2P6NXX8_9EUKA|nr:tyrosine-protein kinase Fer isoform b [Planoprotostelium fungivorum]